MIVSYARGRTQKVLIVGDATDHADALAQALAHAGENACSVFGHEVAADEDIPGRFTVTLYTD